MKKLPMLVIFVIMSIGLSGCDLLDKIFSKAPSSKKIEVTDVSLTKGVTVNINNVPCNFPYTTDKVTVLKEVRHCMIKQTVLPNRLVGSTEKPDPITIDDKDADRIMSDILKASKK